jgi:hypothetical protein
MAGYLDAYGAGDEKRERLVKRIVIWGLAVVVTGAALYFIFRNYSQEQTVKQFFHLLEQKDYQDAYKMWGCTQDTPCKYYPPDKFTEDWGPSSPFANVSAAKIIHVDACGTGVVFNLRVPNSEDVGLWVQRDTNTISFAPWARCPGPHLQVWEFLRSRLGKG